MAILDDISRDFYIFKNYLLPGSKRPLLASYKLTYRCNLRCVQCPFHTLSGPIPSFQQVVTTLDTLYARGNRIVIFEGGEPMTWKDGNYRIQDVVREAKQRFFCTGMTTNGTFPLDVDTDILWVSIDGFKEMHDRLRGTGIFDQVLSNIEHSRHPALFAHITVNNQNDHEVPDLIRFLSQKVKGVTVQFYYPYYHQDDLFLPFDRRTALIDELISLKRSGLPILNSIAALQALKQNQWSCADWLIDCADPDGSIRQGCYLKGRDDIDCSLCGFSPYTEISLAMRGNIQSILAGMQIFFSR